MVYIKTWSDFETAVIDVYTKSPRKTRYVVKFVPKTGQLVLKVTDDTTCIMYKTHSAIILNRFESLNLRLLSTMANRRRPVLVSGPSTGAATPQEGDVTMGGTVSPAAAGTPAPPSPTKAPQPKSGGKKKKKGKR